MSAGTFLCALVRKKPAELRNANIEKAAADHGIPVEWARFYLTEEINRRG